MASTNDITGDAIASKPNSDAYRSNYDRIFGKGRKADASAEANQPAPVDLSAFRAERQAGQAEEPKASARKPGA